ncbi:hypothetical protein GGP41_001327 [Bipolaris sorokiniana]|uniref:Uncharacterized protein n=1 Tax=Cochliobolus sativus TaxID=45130 RepID=A0A8H5Z7T1_COCSA|nr:hypothetical protein GGP41_001327 [Bipolaris sorokiniana]
MLAMLTSSLDLTYIHVIIYEQRPPSRTTQSAQPAQHVERHAMLSKTDTLSRMSGLPARLFNWRLDSPDWCTISGNISYCPQ